jgi:cyclase
MKHFIRNRVIPCLLLNGNSLVKTVKFSNKNYIGNPINAIKIFNDMEVDEIIILDIGATRAGGINFKNIENITSECFMPMAYGGGIKDVDEIEKILYMGIEKVILNNILFQDIDLINRAIKKIGSQSIVASVDIKKNFWNKYYVYNYITGKSINEDPIDRIKMYQEYGAGEIFINFVDKDGTWSGYDLDFIKKVSGSINIPLISCGGARDKEDIITLLIEGGSSSAIGSLAVYQGKDLGVLINFPDMEYIERKVYESLC